MNPWFSLERRVVLVVIGKGSGITSLPGDARANLTVSPHSMHDLVSLLLNHFSSWSR